MRVCPIKEGNGVSFRNIQSNPPSEETKQSSSGISSRDHLSEFSPKFNPKFNQLGTYQVSNISFGRLFKPQEIQLGCNYDPRQKKLNFAVASKNATQINVYLFDKPVNGEVIKTIKMNKKGDTWVADLSQNELKELNLNVRSGKPVYYGYRAWGPNWTYDKSWEPGSDKGFKTHVDDKGNRFNPNKLLTDPYAKEISHDPISPNVQKTVDGTIYATGDEYYLIDSANLAPKSIFVFAQNKPDTGKKPQRAIKNDVIYEVHLRGFTKLDENIPENLRGTYKGAAMKAKYLKDMGVTMVEFLPVQEFEDDINDLEGADTRNMNYWGYNTLNFFAPNRRYAHDRTPGGPTKEFAQMVKAFHNEGIKVCMDVVYNHSGEGGLWDNSGNITSLYSMRGLDSSTYYELARDPKYFYDVTGCGANMNVANNITRDLFSDSLKYWAEDMGVDAFRFDLAPALANSTERDGFNFNPRKDNGFIRKLGENLDIRSDNGKKGSVDLIAEPWSCASWNLGGFPKIWREWNGLYRDTIRKTFNAQERTPFSQFAAAVAGSSNVFGDEKTRSVNFITCHDGFTMKDLFSYNGKRNNFPGFSSDGGSDDNISWDNFSDPQRQQQAMRNAIATLMVSKGTPMILGGDEIMRTQLGNNNAYNLDTAQNYLNWDLNSEQEMMQEFTKRAMHFRASHKALRDNKIFNGKDNNGNKLKDVTWLKPDATEADGNYLDNPGNNFLGFRIDGSEFEDSAASIYTILNKGEDSIDMQLPKNMDGKHWYLAADTSKNAKSNNFAEEGNEQPAGSAYKVDPRSMMIFIEK